MFKKFFSWLANLFTEKEVTNAVSPHEPSVPKQPVPETDSPEWMGEARKQLGKKETDSKFSAFMSGFWKLVGLSGYTSIAGNSRAWCALFIVAIASAGGGYKYAATASAKRQGQASASTYHTIDWKKNGIPEGAIVHINHLGVMSCNSGSNNHVAFANGSCTAEDLAKKGAGILLLGGNQNNSVSISSYPVTDICEVRYFKEKTVNGVMTQIPMPGKVLVSNNCSGKSASGGSTR
jgi:hypothetical protein